VTGFEPATTRPPDVYATGLRHTPIFGLNLQFSKILKSFKNYFLNPQNKPSAFQ